MTVDSIAAELFAAGIEDAENEAFIIASCATGRSKAQLLASRRDELPARAASDVREILRRRVLREPLQYIIGEWDFMGLTYSVSNSCLIPRADTEILCEAAIAHLPQGGLLLDLCCGSGCIGISVAKKRPDADVTLLELYSDAMDVARTNARRLLGGTYGISFIIADAASEADAAEHFSHVKFDVIVSNPPYVSVDEMEQLEPELSYEPRHALTDGGNGMSIIRSILRIYCGYLTVGGMLAVEHGASQGNAVADEVRALGFEPQQLCDLSGHQRVTFFYKYA